MDNIPFGTPKAIRAAMAKDPRLKAAKRLKDVAQTIHAPAYAQEKAFGNLVSKTLDGLTKKNIQLDKARELPQNALRKQHEADQAAQTFDQDKGTVINSAT